MKRIWPILAVLILLGRLRSQEPRKLRRWTILTYMKQENTLSG